jgi:hypothetical protein
MSGSLVAKGIQTKVSSLVAKSLDLGIACHQGRWASSGRQAVAQASSGRQAAPGG